MTVTSLLTRMAQREAAALMLVPDLRLQVDDPEPEIRFRFDGCPWCDARALPPLREVSTDEVPEPALPLLTVLGCEEITARSLVPLSLIRVPERSASPRFRSRAASWARSARDWSSPAEVHRRLEQLDDAESWLDDALPELRSGGFTWAGNASETVAVLPMATRVAIGTRQRPDKLAASRRGLHFITPHADGPLAAQLNNVYLAARTAAVREALSGSWLLDTPPR
ncbi:MAG TPA: hypothetical protein DGG94_10270 [Micromonosporaceae bacterium]|nr:hypothetical protein [Micromonosporaceae bacterium]HCU50167.1 hypothetical protein [Micromonosporaceae bacterium]